MKEKIICLLIMYGILFSSTSFAQLNQEQINKVAYSEFNKSVSSDVFSTYIDLEVNKQTNENPEFFIYTWYRQVNKIRDYDHYFRIGVYSNGNILGGDLFSLNENVLYNTLNVINQDQARFIAEKNYMSIKGDPHLIIRNGELTWEMYLQDNTRIGIDANTGKTNFIDLIQSNSGTIKRTSFDTTAYYTERYGIYGVFALVLIGGFVYYKYGTKEHSRRKKIK
jgi:hypothetical protein